MWYKNKRNQLINISLYKQLSIKQKGTAHFDIIAWSDTAGYTIIENFDNAVDAEDLMIEFSDELEAITC